VNKLVMAAVASLLIGLPAGASDLSSLCSERDQIFQKIMSGQENDADVARFQAVTTQINDTLAGKFQQHSTEVNNLMSKLQTMEQHKIQVYNTLFGPTTPGMAQPASVPEAPKMLRATPISAGAPAQLTGSITNDVLAPLYKEMLSKSGPLVEANMDIAKYSTLAQKFIAQSKESLNYMYPYRGFGPSSEAGDIITGEQLKVKGLSSALYNQQLIVDKSHLELTTGFLQLASNPGKVPEGLNSLTPDEFNNLKIVIQLPGSNTVEDANWDVMAKQQKYKDLVRAAVDNDPTIKIIMDDIHKFNHRSKNAMLASHIIEPALAGASLTPMFIGPVARTALMLYIMGSGGSEESKLLREMYLDKRMESRIQTIAEEAHMAIDAYHTGFLTNNPTLQAAGETIMNQLAPAGAVQELLK
jgi:hypothetical protein